MSQEKSAARFSRRDLFYLGALLLVAFLVGLRGILNYGYIGQDFDPHNLLIKTFPGGYGYGLTNPPGLYFLGNLIYRHVTDVYYLEIFAFLFLVLNLAGLWVLFELLWRMIGSWRLRYAAAALITFIPFRTIHSLVLASDALTVPLFVAIVLLTLRLFRNPRSVFTWAGLSLTLSAALMIKYTFVGLLVPIAFVVGIKTFQDLTLRQGLRCLALVVFALGIPAMVFLLQMRESRKLGGQTTSGHWKAKETPSIMRWSDILLPQRSDVEIFSAPQYFRDKVYVTRKYSYLGLVHLTSFTDSQNFFQTPPAGVSTDWKQRAQASFFRDRSPRSQTFSALSVAWCLPLSMLAIAGTLGCGALALHALFFPARARVPAETIVVTALAAGFYAPVFFSLTRLGDPYTPGYWLPRLVLPGLLVFFALGYVLLDAGAKNGPPRREKITGTLSLVHAAVACGIFIALLF
ncbi:MAG TPA: hypothetical protein VHO24_01385 [Opitutaceae bacterium]|nr:hypothetical protein [Opitutaceae bacterium]